MSHPLLTDLDFSGNKAINVCLETLSQDPTPVAGRIFFNGTTIRFSDGTNLYSLPVNPVTSIGVTAPITSTGGATPTLGISAANGSAPGSMSATHYSLLAGAASATGTNTLVKRDGSGNFIAGTITADLTGTASNASALGGNTSSFFTDRANHTGTQLAATISNLATVVQAYRLDQFAAPTAAVPFNSQKITGLAPPTVGTDAANKAYVDATAPGTQGFDIGDGTATSFVFTHNRNTRDLIVQLRQNSGNYRQISADIDYTSVNTVTVSFSANSVPTTNQYRVIIQ